MSSASCATTSPSSSASLRRRQPDGRRTRTFVLRSLRGRRESRDGGAHERPSASPPHREAEARHRGDGAGDGRAPQDGRHPGAHPLARRPPVRFQHGTARRRRRRAIGLGGRHVAIPLELDGAEHTKWRKILDPVFTPKKMALLEPRVRERADELIDAFIDRGEVDAYLEWCEPLPSSIFLSIMGIPQSQLEGFLVFKNTILGGAFDPSITPEVRMAAFDALRRVVRRRLRPARRVRRLRRGSHRLVDDHRDSTGGASTATSSTASATCS